MQNIKELCDICDSELLENSFKCQICEYEVKNEEFTPTLPFWTCSELLNIKNEDYVDRKEEKNEYNLSILNTQVAHSHEKYDVKNLQAIPNKKEYYAGDPSKQSKGNTVPKEEECCDWQCCHCGYKNIEMSVKCETCLACLEEGKPNSKYNIEKERREKEIISQENKIKNEIRKENYTNKNVYNLLTEQTNDNIKVEISLNESCIVTLKKICEVSSELSSDVYDSLHSSFHENITESSEQSKNNNNEIITENIMNRQIMNENENSEYERNFIEKKNLLRILNSETATGNNKQKPEIRKRVIKDMSSNPLYNSKDPLISQPKQAVRSDMPCSSSYGVHYQTENNNSIQTQSDLFKEKKTRLWSSIFQPKKGLLKDKCSHCNKGSAKSQYGDLCKKCHSEYNKHNNSK